MINEIKRFSFTTLIGGLLVLLPITIFGVLVKFLFDLISNFLNPIAALFGFIENEFLVQLVSFALVIAVCFFVGLAVRTRSGKAYYTYLEKTLLERLPFYSTIRGTVQQLFGDKGSSFSKVVLIEVFDVKMTGFVTSESPDGIYTVFVPTAPNPTNGFIFHTTPDKLTFLEIGPEDAMRTVIGVGTGSDALFQKSKKEKIEQN